MARKVRGSRMSLRERISAVLGRNPGIQIYNQLDMLGLTPGGPKGRFVVRHGRGGRTINEISIPNLITNEGKNDILGVYFHADTQLTTWYLGLLDGAGFSAVAATDTYDNIDQAGNGWDEFVDYTDRNNADSAVTRPVWVEQAPSGQAITNSTLAIYDFTDAGTVQGLAVVAGASAATKGDHSAGTGHKLWAATEFASPIPVSMGDDLSVTYSVAW